MERLHFEPMSGCWIWGAAATYGGYGLYHPPNNGKRILAHRYSYELHKGVIPDGMDLDHLCRNRACCNPDHLEPVTPKENNLRSMSPWAINARKKTCIHGHPLDGIEKRGYRFCRVCNNKRNQECKARKRQKLC